MSTGKDKFNGFRVLCHLSAVNSTAVVPDLLVQQVQARCGSGARMSRHVCHVPGAGNPHRAECFLPCQRSHLQAK